MFQPIHTANTNVIKALGRSDIRLKQEIITKIVGLILLFSSLPYGTLAIAYAYLIGNFFNQFINSFPNKKLINYSYFEQMRDIMPATLLALFMGVCIYSISFLEMPTIIILFFQLITGLIVYIGGSVIFKIDAFQYLYRIIKNRFFAEK